MSDLLIRGVPEDVLRGIDVRAAKLGISRSEYLRRRLAQDAAGEEPLSVAQLKAFGEEFADLGDEGVMTGAWE
ncbi:MAG: ribbon-helix-helix protein, CopG family [Microbacteriaceae bacterium]|nr:MAG: ribbon-helix-helix protein, CopG family [Microbacteriaceae bacterium]